MSRRSVLARLGVGLAVAVLPVVAVGLVPVSAKGTPSVLSVTCGGGVTSATVTFQLMSGTTNPTPASNMVVENCTSTAGGKEKISALTSPAAAYSWSVFATTASSTFGCGGTVNRGTSATCTNDAGGPGSVTVLAT
jgi:hypothetical protein